MRVSSPTDALSKSIPHAFGAKASTSGPLQLPDVSMAMQKSLIWGVSRYSRGSTSAIPSSSRRP